MFKKTIYILTIYFFSVLPALSNTNVFIVTTVNNEIITNYDIKKEIEYLQILNQDLESLDDLKKKLIAKNSLVNEIIKKKEIIKIFDLEEKNSFVDQYLKDLYTKLNVDNEKDFINALSNKKNYSIKEIKEKIKIEILWNELIYSKYVNQIKINQDSLIEKINNLNNKTQKEYFLSEIVFVKPMSESLDDLIQKIRLSILEIGFNNTANIYSVSESSKLGGKLGWINENNLSENISNELKSIKDGEYSNIINIRNNYMFLKIEESRLKKISINRKFELDKMIKYETNKQLNQFSRIYFDKLKINYSINEN